MLSGFVFVYVPAQKDVQADRVSFRAYVVCEIYFAPHIATCENICVVQSPINVRLCDISAL